nr:hypothetical protein [Tanacetum cinerariifolium]
MYTVPCECGQAEYLSQEATQLDNEYRFVAKTVELALSQRALQMIVGVDVAMAGALALCKDPVAEESTLEAPSSPRM